MEIGAGAYRECQFEVYDTLRTIKDHSMGHLFSDNPNLLIFGHDFSGDCSAFDIANDYAIVELWHDSRDIYATGKSFKKSIEKKCLMNEVGRGHTELSSGRGLHQRPYRWQRQRNRFKSD